MSKIKKTILIASLIAITGCAGQRELIQKDGVRGALAVVLFGAYLDHTYDNKSCVGFVVSEYTDNEADVKFKKMLHTLFESADGEHISSNEVKNYEWKQVIFNESLSEVSRAFPRIPKSSTLHNTIEKGDFVKFINWDYDFNSSDKPYAGNQSGMISELVCKKSDKVCKKANPIGCTELDGSPLKKGTRPSKPS